MDYVPKPGEIYQHGKDKPYQIITIASHTQTGEKLLVYQNLYDDYKTYVMPLSQFSDGNEKDHHWEPEVLHNRVTIQSKDKNDPFTEAKSASKQEQQPSPDQVNSILIDFLDAESYHKKLEVVATNLKNMDDKLINNMAVTLDCTIEEGPLDKRIQELIYCLKAMSRFEDRRKR